MVNDFLTQKVDVFNGFSRTSSNGHNSNCVSSSSRSPMDFRDIPSICNGRTKVVWAFCKELQSAEKLADRKQLLRNGSTEAGLKHPLHFGDVTTRQCFGDGNIAPESVRHIFLVAQERAAVATREGSSANFATKYEIFRFLDLRIKKELITQKNDKLVGNLPVE